MRKIVRMSLAFFALLGVIVVLLLGYAYPALAAVGCPSCFGMEYGGPRLLVDRDMPTPMRGAVVRDAEAAALAVKAFYGEFGRRPFLVACSTEDCDRRIGGRGAYAVTISTPVAAVLRLSPRGLNRTILTHEFSHVELHRRIGLRALFSGAFPAWFDEGVAALVSSDERYIRSGEIAGERCVSNRDGLLPVSPFEWGKVAGADHMIYADAACRVSSWLETNGGRNGLLRVLDDVANGIAFAPDNGSAD
ncbi:hypothetical protein QYR00_06110 [Agrobacterium tumefaciens]|jgi:hypothetical protein|nr:hypothetical protein Agau_C200875 [Agrobacterium tumefaciens F2]WKL21336.1 hypothetical protein QYR00_06110 [Agrobacterium tumefaciens]